jgi:hypothetical protein
MPKVICPNCKKVLKIGDHLSEKIAQTPKIWFRCPKCLERFHPVAADLNFNQPEIWPQPAVAPAPSRFSLLTSKIGLFAANDRSHLTDPLDFPGQPGAKVASRLILKVTPVLMVLVGVVYLCSFFVRAPAEAPPDPSQTQAGEPKETSYALTRLPADLAILRKELTQNRQVEKVVDYHGPVWRVYEYFTGELTTGLCQNYVGIRLWSLRTTESFKLQGQCVDRAYLTPELQIEWDDNQAQVTMAGQRAVKTVVFQ